MILLNVVIWYIVIALAGWLAFPLAYRLLSFLPDRGLALARPLGLLLWGYLYWLLVSLHLLQNDTGGVFFALLLVAALSALTLRGGAQSELAAWLRARGKLVLTTELLFLAAFAAWAVVRAAVPDASGTEKPMELAFINAILRSPTFPPSDPWLSGYAISYYYFGYVIVAMLARFTATAGAVAFNLALASWFALTALAAYGLLYNLLSGRMPQVEKDPPASYRLWALLAPLFLLIVSNLQGFLEMLHARGLFWGQSAQNGWQSSFWRWLDIQELTRPPVEPFSWIPDRVGGIWWWRASRVLQDYALDGGSREIIDEFPMFSFLLGDLHPHVLAMPFALLATALALNVYYKLRSTGSTAVWLGSRLRSPDFWLAALVLGSLAFFNTWDFPIYLALYAAAVVAAQYSLRGWDWSLVYRFLGTMLILGTAGGILYLPFYLGFSSQAGGILPSLVFFTRGAHLWVMFAPLLLPIAIWLLWRMRRSGNRQAITHSILFAVGLVAGLWLLSSLMGILLLQTNPSLAGIYGAGEASGLIGVSILRRIGAPGGWLTLLALLVLVWGLFLIHRSAHKKLEQPASARAATSPRPAADHFAQPFVGLLILVGLGLVLFPEFFYLRDQFGWRMNTIFKFYFQAWILWSVAAAYASVMLLRNLRGNAGRVFQLGWLILVLISLPYPIFGVLSRTNNFSPAEWTLDGAAYLDRYAAPEMEAIRWLQDAPYGVVVEAVGGSYSGYARVSTHSGLPTVLGWPGHESQWRGGYNEIGSRQQDITQLYRARQWPQINALLEQYNIRYVYMGSFERNEYRPDEAIFQTNLNLVFDNGSVTIYEVPRFTIQQGQVMQP
jgi:YYY domain-containing protein